MQLSNELKAVAVMADMSESGVTITRDQCMSVEHFDYHCERKRDKTGRTYNASEPVLLCFSVRVNAVGSAHPLYEQLTRTEAGTMSFIFNATFSGTKRLTGYFEAMVVEGYVVDVKESLSSATLSGQSEQQIILSACMLVRSINYIGQNDTKTLCFIH